MNWSELFHHLTDSERLELTYLLLRRIHAPRRMRLHQLRPIHLLLLAVLAQMAVFVPSILARDLPQLLAGYLLVTALAILPSAFSRPRPAAHWVRSLS